ncbi:MAG: MOSC domain-containing protein [Candidatus Promineifilaceae bacterium]
MAKLIGIAVRPEVDAAMVLMDQTIIREESGVDGDYRRGRGARQVTVLFKDQWEAACRAVDTDLPWTTRRANLLVDGMTLADCKGLSLAIGDTILEVTGETLPCNLMEAAQSGLRAALGPNWRGGVTCRVIQTGAVAVGDTVAVLETTTLI